MAPQTTMILIWLCCGTVLADVYTYDKQTDFAAGLDFSQLKEEIKDAGPGWSWLLMGMSVRGNIVTVTFGGGSLTATAVATLNAVVAAHVPETLAQKFCKTLANTDGELTSAQLRTAVLIVPASAGARTYSLKTAADMVRGEHTEGRLCLVNADLINAAVVAVKTGGSTVGSMTVSAGASAHFIYRVTDDGPGAEAYVLARIG